MPAMVEYELIDVLPPLPLSPVWGQFDPVDMSLDICMEADMHVSDLPELEEGDREDLGILLRSGSPDLLAWSVQNADVTPDKPPAAPREVSPASSTAETVALSPQNELAQQMQNMALPTEDYSHEVFPFPY